MDKCDILPLLGPTGNLLSLLTIPRLAATDAPLDQQFQIGGTRLVMIEAELERVLELTKPKMGGATLVGPIQKWAMLGAPLPFDFASRADLLSFTLAGGEIAASTCFAVAN